MTPQLHPYQWYSVQFIECHPKCSLFLDMGLGKAIDDDTMLPTPDGLRRAGDIQPGDKLFSMTGAPTAVTAVYKHPNKPAYKVTLDDGRSFVCCDEHLVPVLKPGTESITPIPLQQLMDNYKIHDPDTGETTDYRFAIPWTAPVSYPKQDLPYDGRIMGAMASFGQVDSYGPAPKPDAPDWVRTEWNRTDNEARDKLTQDLAQVWNQDPMDAKFPDWVIETDPMFKCELLAGLTGLDLRDIASMRKTKFLSMELQSQTMARQIEQIVWSIGHRVETKYRPKKKVTELKIWFDSKETKAKGLFITDISPVGNRDMTCFTVDHYTHTYLINDYLVTHNTLITLMALWRIQPAGHILVIAPKTVAMSTWQNEIDKWQIPVRTKSLIINERGKELTKKKRLELYDQIPDEPSSMYFINRELFTDLVANLPIREGQRVWPFGTIIVDELQSFKNYTSQRTKALAKVAPLSERFIGLTGTPTPEGLMDLWPEIYFMDSGARLGKNITAYRNRWFKPTMIVNNHPVGWIPLPNAENEIYSLIGDRVVSIENPNLQLTAVTYNDVHIKLSADEMDLYKSFAKESALILDDGKTVTAKNAGQLRIKLTQLASGSVYTELGNSDSYRVIHERKLDMCEYIVNNTSGGILIAYQFQADRAMLKERFPQAVIFDGSNQMQQDWNQGKIPILLLNPASSGHGLNIQYGGHTLVWYTTPTNLEYYLQCNARLARQGQPNPVTIHHLIVDGTVDKGNMALIQTKDETENRLIEAVQAALDEVLS